MEIPTNLELFVLAMVQTGLATPYDLKVKAGLSLGSTIPLLARLEKQRLIAGAKADARNSRKFSITPAAAKLLKTTSWDELQADVTDPDSALRIAYLAWKFGSRRKAAAVLSSVAERLKTAGNNRRSEARRAPSTALSGPPSPDVYRWLRLSYEAGRMAADAASLLELAGDVHAPTKEKLRKR